MTETDWLDGPRIVKWLEERVTRYDLGDYGPLQGYAKRIRDWRSGDKANVYILDEVLVRLGLTMDLVPTDLYVETPHKGPKINQRTAELIRAEATGPESYAPLAERYGCSRRTIRKIVKGEAW